MKIRNWMISIGLVFVAAVAIAQLPGSNYREQGGLRTVIGGSLDVASGGEIDIEAGAGLKIDGQPVAFGEVVLCGQLANNGTIYLGPATDSFEYGGSDYSIGGTACDALDSATEATADAPIVTNVALTVTGMYCKASSSGSNGVAFTARSAGADLSTSLTCTVPTTETDCTSSVATPVEVAAGATLAIKAVDTEDLSAQDGWCKLFLTLQ